MPVGLRDRISVAGSASVATSPALIPKYFAFFPLAAVRIGSGFEPSALPRRVATWRANNDLWINNTASTPPHRPIEFFAYNYFDCCRRGSSCCLCARQSRPARSTTAVNLFYLRTTV
jgi:hypothetical protein